MEIIQDEGSPKSGINLDSTLLIQATDSSGLNLQVQLSQTNGLVIGRSDSRSSYIPDVDLAEMKALEKGVSRRHAAFVRLQEKLHILDLGSINGTYLNGTRLKPETPYLINSGDQLGLGDLVVTLSVKK
ncbi:MAG: FHA domain-containing protein [Anaerolineae bacterium]